MVPTTTHHGHHRRRRPADYDDVGNRKTARRIRINDDNNKDVYRNRSLLSLALLFFLRHDDGHMLPVPLRASALQRRIPLPTPSDRNRRTAAAFIGESSSATGSSFSTDPAQRSSFR